MKYIWSGGISFGLVYIPVRLYNASKRKELEFHLFRKRDMCPISYVKICKTTGDVVQLDEIVKGYEYEKGKFVKISDEDFEKASVRQTKSIEIVNFVDEDEIDSKYFEKPYYLEPETAAKKIYSLFLQALKKTKKVGIAKFVLRNHEHLALLKPDNNALALIQMRFDEEMLSPAEIGLEIAAAKKISKDELETAISIIEKMSKPFKPEKYSDTYTNVLKKAIREKVLTKVIKSKEKAPKPTEAIDLMKKLKKSLKVVGKK